MERRNLCPSWPIWSSSFFNSCPALQLSTYRHSDPSFLLLAAIGYNLRCCSFVFTFLMRQFGARSSAEIKENYKRVGITSLLAWPQKRKEIHSHLRLRLFPLRVSLGCLCIVRAHASSSKARVWILSSFSCIWCRLIYKSCSCRRLMDGWFEGGTYTHKQTERITRLSTELDC